VRIPILVVVLLCLGVVAAVWWLGTRDHDFLTPPPESELAAIREKVASSIPPADHPDEMEDASPATAPEPTEPSIEPGDFNKTPTLAEYRKDARMGAAALTALATYLEDAGQPQRALLAWERVLDSAPPDPEQTSAAIAAIKRLRSGLSAWNTDPEAAIPITLHAGTGKTTAALLEPLLIEVASELSSASSGILNVSAQVTSGIDIPDSFGPPPVALWFAGSAVDSRSTEVLSFTVDSPENLRADLLDTLCQLLRGYLGRTASLAVPEIAADGALPEETSLRHITRLSWLELGTRLNQRIR
jgi:hypothetical protein